MSPASCTVLMECDKRVPLPRRDKAHHRSAARLKTRIEITVSAAAKAATTARLRAAIIVALCMLQMLWSPLLSPSQPVADGASPWVRERRFANHARNPGSTPIGNSGTQERHSRGRKDALPRVTLGWVSPLTPELRREL